MGSPPNEPDRSKREGFQEVTLTRGFWLGKYEVTQAQWDRLMPESMQQRLDRTQLGKGCALGPDFPFFHSDYEDADAFCTKLTDTERAAGRLPAGWRYGLPTEAQWEYACRAGTTTATAFGNSLSSKQANFSGSTRYSGAYNGGALGPDLDRAAVVGSYLPNRWGLYDMHGNVWEWTSDVFVPRHPGGVDPHVTEPAKMVLDGFETRNKHVIRGGYWGSAGSWCRSAHRAGAWGSLYIGFRVALLPLD